jgi:hypothetical protein
VYHRGLATPQSKNLYLNATDAAGASNFWDNTAPTSSVFSLGSSDQVNGNGVTYIAYLFAHNAGGFGLAGTDSIISCGSYTGAYPSTIAVDLGWEPQWVLVKNATQASDFFIFDTIRGMSFASPDRSLATNVATAENATSGSAEFCDPTATGFTVDSGLTAANVSGNTHIYIAIRKGPMKIPTDATKVFRPFQLPLNSASTAIPINAGLTTDTVLGSHNTNNGGGFYFASRLTGPQRIDTSSTAAGASGAYYWDTNVGVKQAETNAQPIFYFLKRAPGFYDHLCYTGNGSGTQLLYHGLKAAPELAIIKRRDSTGEWLVTTLTNGSIVYSVGLNSNSASDASRFQGTAYSAAEYIGVRETTTLGNISGAKYNLHLFATLAGVSKVGSYTGTGTTKQIDCGFAAGARLVLIKRVDATGNWFLWDTARGIVSGNDTYLAINDNSAQVTSTDYIDPYSAGFEIDSSAPIGINANGGTYIFLAIA